MKKITFTPTSKKFEVLLERPLPAVKKIPEWYKKMPVRCYPDLKQEILHEGQVNKTIKQCPPVFDSISSGYIISLPCDVEAVPIENNQHRIMWNVSWDVVSIHGKVQIPGLPLPDGYEDTPFKWISPWRVSTPKGYSVLYTHPFYRNDLPFVSLTGVVDSDLYNSPVHIPFILKKDFNGIIPQGTPIAQLIPIKRETWNSEIKKYNPEDEFNDEKVFMKIKESYKRYWRQKKNYR